MMKPIFKTIFIILPLFFATIFATSCDKGDEPISDEYYEDETGEIEVLLTYENFKKNVKALKIDGYTLMSITSNESGSNEYEATFMQSKGVYLFVKIAELATTEPVWMNEENTYMLDERKTEYASITSISGLTIFLPQVEAEFSVYATVDLGKAEFENIARACGFLTIAPETVDWPASIPDDHKFAGYLIEVEIGSSSTDGFSKEMFAIMLLTDELQKSYESVFDTYYDGNVDHIVFPNGTYLIPPGGYYGNDLYETFDKYERVEFMYYIE